MTFIINQLILAFWNLINSRIDAYRILKNKTIAHGINFAAYALIVGLLIWLGRYDLKTIILFCCSAFFNRQLSFDIPLNKRRGLPWYYQTQETGPKASILDKIERHIWGAYTPTMGKSIALVYAILYVGTMVLYLEIIMLG